MLKNFRGRPLLNCCALWALIAIVVAVLQAVEIFQGPCAFVAALVEILVFPAIIVFSIFYLVGEYELQPRSLIGLSLLVVVLSYYGGLTYLWSAGDALHAAAKQKTYRAELANVPHPQYKVLESRHALTGADQLIYDESDQRVIGVCGSQHLWSHYYKVLGCGL